MAQRYDGAGEPLGDTPTVLVGGISGLSDWFAAGDGADGVVVAWKAGGTTSVRRVLADGRAAYGPVAICSDAAVAALRGTGRHGGACPDRRGRLRRRVRRPSSHAVARLRRHVARVRVPARRRLPPRPRPGRDRRDGRRHGRRQHRPPLRPARRARPQQSGGTTVRAQPGHRLGRTGVSLQPRLQSAPRRDADTSRRRRHEQRAGRVARGRQVEGAALLQHAATVYG